MGFDQNASRFYRFAQSALQIAQFAAFLLAAVLPKIQVRQCTGAARIAVGTH
jgi:hypothetical protein